MLQVVTGDEMKSLQRFPGLQAKILATIDASLDEYRRKSRDFSVNLVKMEGSLIIPQLFKMADENFGEDKSNMGPDAEWSMVRGSRNMRATTCRMRQVCRANVLCDAHAE